MPVGGGIALGLLTSLAATRAIRSLLYETSPADPASIVASVSILLAATLVAAFLPAYRASRVDPMKVLHFTEMKETPYGELKALFSSHLR